ncbi:hypothetical protein [Thalassobellus suaedae]|uniref:Uncharacterized protein n=1 Tax=Thalassobellus suaedae TaxID=3074124 RepID=A0ABY9Y5U7_9FLAO|nr:hypothetical protein RHP49_05060 [Flavobacteriaceae bacterium HL-DH10]
MKNPLLKTPVFLNVVILIISGIISWFALLMGIAHIIEGSSSPPNPDIPKIQAMIGWVVVMFLCIVGIVSLVITVAAILAIFKRYRT